MNLGIDVSSHQRAIDWRTVALTTVDRAVIKASEGTDWTDDYYATNQFNARQHGLDVAAYHFGRPSVCSGHAEAEYFLSVTAAFPAPSRYVLDLEDDDVAKGADLLAYVLDFCEYIADQAHSIPLIYTNRFYAKDHRLEATGQLADFPLWLASWSRNEPTTPKPWREWAGWQFSATNRLPGVGAVDMSLWREPWR